MLLVSVGMNKRLNTSVCLSSTVPSQGTILANSILFPRLVNAEGGSGYEKVTLYKQRKFVVADNQ